MWSKEKNNNKCNGMGTCLCYGAVPRLPSNTPSVHVCGGGVVVIERVRRRTMSLM
eukprot:m.125169 g.125169  ORF g.125169 m.125169 type:complete len:55 (-) comp22109_c0_seq1:216-380(-)